jgi:hypothetical protein
MDLVEKLRLKNVSFKILDNVGKDLRNEYFHINKLTKNIMNYRNIFDKSIIKSSNTEEINVSILV